MANKKITELIRVNNVEDDDLLLLETSNGTRSILYKDITKNIAKDDNELYQFSNHNGILRGKNLTDVYTIDQIVTRIENGTFEDLYIGDYFDVTISTSYTSNEIVRCVIAGLDTYFNIGDTPLIKHHAVIVTKNCFKETHAMMTTEAANIANGFIGTNIWENVIPVYQTAFQSVFNNHILMHRTLLTNDVSSTINSNAGAGQKGASVSNNWKDTYLSLLSEIQLYGANVYSSSAYDTGCDNCQLPLFLLDPTAKICGKNTTIDGNGDGKRYNYWLRNVSTSVRFSSVNSTGEAYTCMSTANAGVRPIFCIG